MNLFGEQTEGLELYKGKGDRNQDNTPAMKEAEQKKREHMNYAFNTTPLIKITNRLLLSCVKNKTC